MAGPVIFIGSYRIPNGAYDTFADGIRGMSAFVESEVRRVRMFHTYVNESRTEGTTLYVHPDGESLAEHLGKAANRIDEGSQMVSVDRILLLGDAPPPVADALAADESYQLVVQQHLVGFTR
jgi:hypothetical protein